MHVRSLASPMNDDSALLVRRTTPHAVRLFPPVVVLANEERTAVGSSWTKAEMSERGA